MVLVKEVYIYIYIYILNERTEGYWYEIVLLIQEQRKKNKGYTFWCSKEDKGEEFGWGTCLLGEEMG